MFLTVQAGVYHVDYLTVAVERCNVIMFVTFLANYTPLL